jgi:thioredoxin:protein disulfide reductase
MNRAWQILALLAILATRNACAADPFSVWAELKTAKDGGKLIAVSFSIPARTHIYADTIKIEGKDGLEIEPRDIPDAVKTNDPASDTVVPVYEHGVTFTYAVKSQTDPPFNLAVSYQGCNETTCFLPVTKRISIGGAAGAVKDRQATIMAKLEHASDWRSLITRFTYAGSMTGYASAAEFTKFLNSSASGRRMDRDSIRATFEKSGAFLSILLILISGLALNLTPCVLPMIPINLAIIGAGAQNGSRRRGLVLGGAYGAGIALVYGALGIAVMLTGTRFGAVNSSPLFNLGVSLVFLLLALSMFGVWNLDLSRFQRTQDSGRGQKTGLLAAFVMGGVAALLAGACVAPAVISVLLLSTELYSRGNFLGVILPFILGIGMALPWPFAGAGLSFLPKPGKWMERVKYAFGVLIVGMSLWYAKEAYSLVRNRSAQSREEVVAAQTSKTKEGWLTSFDVALMLAEQQEKPVLVDFWASWCKNCLAMDKTTFKDPEVVKRLGSFVKVKIAAEDMNDPAVKDVLDNFCVAGLPTYVVLRFGQPLPGQAVDPCERKRTTGETGK